MVLMSNTARRNKCWLISSRSRSKEICSGNYGTSSWDTNTLIHYRHLHCKKNKERVGESEHDRSILVSSRAHAKSEFGCKIEDPKKIFVKKTSSYSDAVRNGTVVKESVRKEVTGKGERRVRLPPPTN